MRVGAASAADKISGEGSSFVKPIMDEWVEEYAKDHKDVEINYQATGSGAGIKSVIDMANDFGSDRDAFMTKENLDKAMAAGGPVLHIPLVLGTVVPAPMPGVKDPLNFDGDALAGIFMGKITTWNDRALAALNPGVKLPDLPIAVVHRSDASGTTFVFASFLSQTNDAWKTDRGAAPSIDWKTVGTGEKGDAGVAAAIGASEGAIGYIELTYALQNKAQFGTVKNKEGEFVLASTKSVTAAADNFLQAKKVPDDLRFNLADAPGKGAYPITGATWALVYANPKGPAGKQVTEFLKWASPTARRFATTCTTPRCPRGWPSWPSKS